MEKVSYRLLNSSSLVRIASYIITSLCPPILFLSDPFLILLFCTWVLQRKSFLTSGSLHKTLCAVHVYPMHAKSPSQDLWHCLIYYVQVPRWIKGSETLRVMARRCFWKFGNHLSSDAASRPIRPQCSKVKCINTSELKSYIYWSVPGISAASWRLQPRNTSVYVHPRLQNNLIRDIRYLKDKINITFRKTRKAIMFLKTRFICESTNNTLFLPLRLILVLQHFCLLVLLASVLNPPHIVTLDQWWRTDSSFRPLTWDCDPHVTRPL